MEKIKLYSKFERFWHWSQTALIVVLGLTGFEIHDSFTLFGYETAVRFHNSAAWAFSILLALAIFWMFVSGQWKNFVPTTEKFKEQFLFYISGIFKGEPHPTHKSLFNKLNPIQRVVYLGLIVVIFPLQLISGFVYMYYHYTGEIISVSGLELTAVLHTASAFLLVAFLIVHLYLITTGTTLSSNLKGMVTGYEDVEKEDTK
jgi:thiosulfate reductase cytochrome b subunit